MGSKVPKLPKEAKIIPTDKKNDEIIFPDEDNVILDHNDKLEQYYVAYSTVTFDVRDLTKYEIDEDLFQSCEDQRGDRHYFKMKNILENYNEGKEIFIKVLDFNPEILELQDINPIKIKNMKINKRIVKEFLIIQNLQARFIEKPIGYFNNRSSQRLYLIYEFVPRRLHDLIAESRLGPLYNKLRLLKNLIDVVMFIHCHGIVSLDISPYSLGVIGESNSTKVLTFGNSVKFTGEAIDILRESWFDRSKFDFFVAPEIYTNRTILLRYCWAADIWSLGILAYIIFRNDYAKFYDSLDEEFVMVENMIYSDDGSYDEERFFEIFDMGKIENPFIKGLITSMLKMEFTERANIFEVADNFNKIIRILDIEEEYEVTYKKSDVLDFTRIFDHHTYELIMEEKPIQNIDKDKPKF